MASTTAPQAQSTVDEVTAQPEKPAFQSYYKSPNQIDASMILFERKPERSGPSVIKTTTFAVGMRTPEMAVATVTVQPPPTAVTAGGRGAGRGRGRGRGVQVAKPAPLAIKMNTAMRTKYGINIGLSTVGGAAKDTTVVDRLKENPHLVNRIAAGIDEVPAGVHFEILFFLDPAEPEHQRLEQLSNECREAFEEFTYTLPHGVVSDKLSTNGFVRVSEKTEERYIVLTMSTTHTVDGKRFYPTPFYTQTDDPVLWHELVQFSFRSEVEFRVNHVMLVGADKASFKSYAASFKLVDTPKRALSDARQAQEAYVEKIKESIRKATGEGGGDCVADSNLESQLADLVSKAGTASSEVVVPQELQVSGAAGSAPGPRVRKAKTTEGTSASKRVVKTVVIPPPASSVVSDEDPAETSPVPNGTIKNLSTRSK